MAPIPGGLTDQQRAALAARGTSVALSAGAGCGKTFVLTERFLAHLEPDGEAEDGRRRLDEVVAITFTERAAREMRDRIRRACRDRLLTAPDGKADYWLALSRELEAARISTIHAFCAELLGAHPVEAGVDPGFRVLDAAEADTLVARRIDGELHRGLADRNEALIGLLVEFTPRQLQDMLLRLLGRRQEIDWDRWARESPDGLVGRWQRFWRKTTLPRLLGALSRSAEARAVLEIAEKAAPSQGAMRARFRTLIERLPNLSHSGDPAADLEAIRGAATVQGGGGAKAWPSKALYERFRKAAAGLRKAIDRVRPLAVFDLQGARPAAKTALRLFRLAGRIHDGYQSDKRRLGCLDFDDLLVRTRDLLVDPAHAGLRKRLSDQIALLLVDEFQDTDPVQVELIEALCGEDGAAGGKLFFVGDTKQSIYRFRGADPSVFQRLRAGTPASGRLPLSLNFRSQPAILDFVNALFCDDLGPEYEPLRPSRPQVGPTPAVELLWAVDESNGDGGDDNGETSRKDRLRRREAEFIARRIRAMLESGQRIVWDEEAAARGQPAARSVRPGDVALLFRALTRIEIYEEALQGHGIDYYLVGGRAFYAQQEIFDLLNLLRAIDNPTDAVSLVGVLRSPFFSLEDETLFWLAQHPEGLAAGLFADAFPEQLSKRQRRRAEYAARALRELRERKDRVGVAELIHAALECTGYDAALLAEFLGQRKLANLRKLIDQARQFDRSGFLGLGDFVTQLARFVARQPDEPLAATCPESTDAVKLMTIHQSKGLEFPVVIVPDLDRRMQGSTEQVAFTPELGPMVKMPSGGGFELYAAAQQEEDRAEILRLLYVAATRAADYLILSAGVPQIGSAAGPWTEVLGRRLDPATGRWKVRLPDGYVEPAVRVTMAEPPVDSKRSRPGRRPDLDKLVDEAEKLARQGDGSPAKYAAPLPPDRTAQRRFSFSRLTGLLHERAVVPSGRGDDFEQPEPPVDPLGLGTLVHAVLAEVSLDGSTDIASLVQQYAARHLPDVDTPPREAVALVERFLASPRAKAIAAAAEAYRELEFLLAWPPGGDDASGRYLQGFIDCLYQDAQEDWHVLDYKTNRVEPGRLAEVAAGYEMQMLVYGLAVEEILGRPPAELVLHFLRPGSEHTFAWNHQTRRRAIRMVDEAVAALTG